MKDILFIVAACAVFGSVLYLVYFLRHNRQPQEDISQKLMLEVIENLRKSIQESNVTHRKELQDRFDKITEFLNQNQHRSLETLQKQFGQSAKIIEEVTHKLTKLDETNKQVMGFAEQMKSLENILKNPKHRGILGEYLLETLLGNILAPDQYAMQYKFRNGEIVDAVIFFKDTLIPIDAKFSLEKYNLLMQEQDKIRQIQLEKEFRIA